MGGGNETPKVNKVLPVPNSTASYWRSEPHWLDEYRSTEQLPPQADIVIIGTGIAGVSTAYHLLQTSKKNTGVDISQPSILLLEARQVCSGATGRNGGHIKKLPSTIIELIDNYGDAAAGEIVKFIRENIYAVKSVIEKEEIEAEAELRRSFDVSIDGEDARQVKKEFDMQVESGFPLVGEIGYVGEEFAERITSIHNAKAGLSTPVLSLWPYKFVTQLLERVLSNPNTNLQTNTPVTAIETITSSTNTESTNRQIYTVTTPRGQIKYSTIIFATNGYTAGLLPQYQSIIHPTKATACHITTPSDRYAPYLSNTYNIRYTSDRIDYLNPRPDGGIVVGGGKWTYEDQRHLWYDVHDDSSLLEPAKGHFDGLMQRYYCGWEGSGARTESIWTGIQGVTKDGLPHIGRVPGTTGQYILAGYNGGGMAMAFLAAKAVAKMIGEGVEFEETGVPRCMETTQARLDGKKKI